MELRIATHADVPALCRLIETSGRALSAGFYSTQQADAIVRHVFGVDSQLIDDATYFLIEREGWAVACGGWSRRHTLFGGDQAKAGPDTLLDPGVDAARVRAFFVSPECARQGLGRRLLSACEDAARRAGFRRLELVATAPGEPLYAACGFAVTERFELDLPGDVQVPVSRMSKTLDPAAP